MIGEDWMTRDAEALRSAGTRRVLVVAAIVLTRRRRIGVPVTTMPIGSNSSPWE